MTAADVVRSHFRTLRNSRLEVGAAAVLLLGTTTIGLLYGVNVLPAAVVEPADPTSPLATLVWILQRNLPAALLMFSGILTFGLTALAGGAGIGLFLGHSMALSVTTFGPAHVITHSFLYTPLELYGFVLAFAAGLTPISMFVDLRNGVDRAAFGVAVHRSLLLLGSSIVALVLAALLEMTNILLTR